MAKFKVGDKVIAKANTPYNVTTKGWKGTVVGTLENPNGHFFYPEDDIRVKGDNGNHYSVHSKYFDFDFDSSNQKIVITTDGKTTTAKLYDGKKFVKAAKAKCSPDDVFDFNVGALLSVGRLVNADCELVDEELHKFTKEDLKTGMFVYNNRYGLAVIANDKIIYEAGGYDDISTLSDDLCFLSSRIDMVLKAYSFDGAKRIVKTNSKSCILYRRSGI